MAVTIYLDCEHQFGAEEINDEPIDGLLAIKVIAKHSFSFELVPQQDFGESTLIPQLPSKRF